MKTLASERVELASASGDHSLLGCEHPLRDDLADEVHARPSEALETPCRATCVAKLIDPGERAQVLRHLADLCSRFSVEPPAAEANHFVADLSVPEFATSLTMSVMLSTT